MGLILSRRVNETIELCTSDGPITVVVCRLRGGQVWLRFEAAPQVAILRSEVIARVGRRAA